MGAPHIVGSELVHRSDRLPFEVRNAQTRWQSREGVVLLLRDREGRLGVGEASPLPGFSSESLADCMQALAGVQERIAGTDAEGWPVAAGLHALPAAQFAWESAVADLWARSEGISVAKLLGGPRDYGAATLNALITTVEDGKSALHRKVTTLKVKLGLSDFDAELAFLRELRSELGFRFALRLDGNGGWSVDAARRKLEQLAELHPEFIEQPVAAGELARLGRCAVPWAADESLRSPEEAEALLHAEGCAAWVIKPAAVGLRQARRLAVAAQEAGLGVVITHLFDGPVGLTAARELAMSLPSEPWACGLDWNAGVAVWPEVQLPHEQLGSSLWAHGRSGLGFAKEGLPWS